MSSRQVSYTGGFDVDVKHVYGPKKTEPLDESEIANYTCFVCGKILRNPQQVPCCGRRSCRVCIDELRRKFGKVFNCPQCGSRIGDSSTNVTFTDQSCINDLKRFFTICCTKPRCNWKGPLLQIEEHMAECGNVIIECTLLCGMKMMRRELQNHLITDCELRMIRCHFCKENVQVLVFQEHLLVCKGKKDSTCPFCETKCQSNAELHEHVYSGRCTKALLSCPVRALLHCNAKVSPTQRTEHCITHMTEVIQHNVQQRADLQSELDSLRRKCAKDENELIRQAEDMQMLKQTIEKQAGQHKLEIQSLQTNIEALSSRLSNLPAAIQPSAMKSSDLSHMEGIVRTLQHNVDSLTRQVQTMNSKVEENSEQAGALQTGIDQCTTAINQVNGLLNEVGLKVDILAVRSINGILIWKVNEVEKRIEEARTGKILSLYSPPFFTSLHGYRMCLRLYLDGDGQGKGTHVSLFLVIMKSDYDDLLSWPFKQKVTLYLLNQQDPYNTRAHIAQAFRPTETSTSFQKPKGPFNTASGFPRFAPIAKLYDRSYVQDDCMYFKVKIDMTDLKAPDFPAY